MRGKPSVRWEITVGGRWVSVRWGETVGVLLSITQDVTHFIKLYGMTANEGGDLNIAVPQVQKQ